MRALLKITQIVFLNGLQNSYSKCLLFLCVCVYVSEPMKGTGPGWREGRKEGSSKEGLKEAHKQD